MAIAGLRGTGHWTADEMPMDYREGLLYLEPNGRARLTAIMAKLRNETTSNYKFNIFEKNIPVQRTTVDGSQADDDEAIEVDTGTGKIFKAGHAVINERTLEIFFVISVLADVLTVERAKGKVPAAVMNTGDGLLIITSHYAEDSDIPSMISYAPGIVENYVELFRTSIELTELAQHTKLRTGNAYKEFKREANLIHGVEQEKAWFFGALNDSSSGNMMDCTTGGLLYWLTSNVVDFSDAVTIESWESFLMDLFAYGSKEKNLFCGNTVLMIINRMAREYGHITLVPETEVYGLEVIKYVTPFGKLNLWDHPLLSENPTFNDWGFVVDFKYIVRRPHVGLDTKFKTDIKKDGKPIRYDEFRTYAGLELRHEKVHGILKNFSAMAA